MVDPERVRKLRWLCRRGMKELDILLERFIQLNQGPLAAGEWPELESLLHMEDDVLWDWLQDKSVPEASNYRNILTQILSG